VLTLAELRITAGNPAGHAAEVLKVETTIRGWYLPRGEAVP
jgi:hypothetical protein